MLDFVSSLMLLGAVGSNGNAPFWQTANQYGIFPESSGSVLLANAYASYDGTHDFRFSGGLSLAGRTDAQSAFQIIPDEAFAGVSWKCLSLDLGIKHGPVDFTSSSALLGSISTSSGRICCSGNARALPGYTLELKPFSLTGKNNVLQIFGTWGDYWLTDSRYSLKNPMVHNMRAYLRLNVKQFSFTAGVDHFAMWGGAIPEFGEEPCSFEDYLRMCVGSNASSTGTAGDQINVIGNQLGGMSLRLDWNASWGRLSFLHDIPYEDRSGMRFENFPDGINTLCLSFKDKDRWISDIAYEFIYTMNQSGPIHDRPATEEELKHLDPDDYWTKIGRIVLKGEDDYFNHEDYRSGWTHYGRTMGLPLFFPTGTHSGSWNRGDVTLGVENNRIIAHHLGVSGKLFRKYPYRLMLTYSRNYGTFKKHRTDEEYCTDWPGYRQFSSGFTTIIPFMDGRLQLLPGIYFDRGEMLKDSFAFSLGLRYVIH